MADTTAPQRRGRPKSEGKRTAIIDAARRLFAASVYETVTIDQVASAAGVARMTVYGHFHDKEALFEAMIQSTTDMMAAALPTGLCHDGDLEEALVAFGEAVLTVLFSPGVLSSFQTQFEMLSRNRDLAQRFFDTGPGNTRARLAAYLRSAAGWIEHPPAFSVVAASDLMSLWIGDRPQRVAMGLAEPITPDEIAQHVRRCTQLFLKGYGIGLAKRPVARQIERKKHIEKTATRDAHASRRKRPPRIE